MLAMFLVSVTVVLLACCQQTLQSAWRLPNRPALQGVWALIPSLIPATVGARGPRATSAVENSSSITTLAHAAARVSRPAGPATSREARRQGRDPLRHHRATVGPDARTPWYVPVRSFILLVLLVACIGMAVAGVTLLIIGSGRFVLEILAG